MKFFQPTSNFSPFYYTYTSHYLMKIHCLKKTIFSFLFSLFTLSLTAQKVATTLRLKTGNLVVKGNMTADVVNEELRKGRFAGSSYLLLVFEHPLTTTQQQSLRSLGIEFLSYLPDNSYQVRMKQVPLLSQLFQDGVRAMITMPGLAKLGKELKTTIANTNSDDRVLVNLQLQPGVKWEEVQALLAFYGVTLTKSEYLNQGLAQVSVASSKVSTLSDLPFVAYLNLSFLHAEVLNQRERGMFGLTNLTSMEVAGRNLSGNGITIGIGDNADVSLHMDNAFNTINRNPAYSGNGHGRLVGGTAAGNGIIEERYKGVAPKSLMISDYFDYILTKSPTYFADYNMTVTNNSFYNGLAGCPGNSEYNELSVYVDQQMYNNPYLQHIFAAGNDGGITCLNFPLSFATIKSGYQVGKNVLDVADYHITNDALNLSSSKGPVEDGRIKPEIAASGAAVVSTGLLNVYNAGYGTSHSAPFVTGVWSLLTERYKQLHGNALPKNALLKAVICNSGDDKGNSGPDYGYGFGLINPRKAVEMIEQSHYFSGTLSTGGNNTQTISVPSGTRQVKVMLYWHDKEASPLSSTSLVNDLDLSVTDGVTTYLPWILNPSPASVNSNATRGIDRINNIEQVTIDNPGTSISISLKGFNVPTGAQEYFVTYEFLKDEIKLEHPYGGERFSPGQEEVIKWTAMDNSSNTFTLEYSIDNGVTWTLIDNNLAANQHRYRWLGVPNTPTNKGKVRITRNGGGASMTSPGNFTILSQPNLTATVPCEGYVNLSWAAVDSASDYEVLQLANGLFVSLGTTSAMNYRVSGLDKTQTYWFTVRARMKDSLGMRAVAKNIIPASGTPCTAVEFNNDLKIDTLLSPANGRTNTSTQLSATQQITVRIKNLDDAATSGSYTISYQINGGSVITESSAAIIAAGGTVNYTFTNTANLSAAGTYAIRVFVKKPGDAQPANDELTFTVKHVANPAVTLPFIETFESTSTAEYRSNLFALTNADRFDFSTANNNGRFRTFVNTGVGINGNRTATLDAVSYNGTLSNNSLTATINLSNYASTPGLRFDFRFKNHGQFKQPPTGVWMRGKDTDPWIQVYDLNANQGSLGEIKQPTVNIKDFIPVITSSFQVRFDQQGKTSANNGSYDSEISDMDDGYSFDDIRILAANNDVMVTKLVAPSKFTCAPGNAGITIRVKNTTSTSFSNVPVFYRINNGNAVAETIVTLNANSQVDYTFTTLADLSTSRAYDIDAWVKLSGDDYPLNDSITNQFVYSTPVNNSFPYLERFETGNGKWFTDTLSYSSWRWGKPEKTVINRSASESKGWFTTLNSTYKQYDSSYLYSPCFNLSSLTQPVFSFSHISQQEDNCNCDYHSLEYSTDNGNTWQRLPVVNGTNWFDSTANQSWRKSILRWHVSSTEVPKAANIRFRFLMSSDEMTEYEGAGIDDIHIFEKGTIYTGTDVANINATVTGNNWVDFKSGGKLVASINPLGQNLGSTNVSVYINSGPVRFLGDQYYLDRNLVIRSANTPSDSVLIRFYFTEQEIKAMLDATGCSNCIKLKDAYLAAVTKYSGSAAFENGLLNDESGGTFLFIDSGKVDVVPYNNGYYAEFKVNSFSEFWIHATDYKFNPIPVGVTDVPRQEVFIKNVYQEDAGNLFIMTGNKLKVQEINIRIVNAMGQEVMSKQTSYSNTRINISTLSAGIYFIEIKDKKGKEQFVKKIMKTVP